MNRAERRRLERERRNAAKRARPGRIPRTPRVGSEILAEGVEPGSPEAILIEEQAAATAAILADDRSLDATLALAGTSARTADELCGRIMPVGPHSLACAEGCSYCCYLKVNAAIPEVFAIAAALREQLGEEELRALRERIHDFLHRVRTLTGDRRMAAREACPLLADRRCSVYAQRPLTCRGWNSLDVECCRRSYETPGPEVPALLFGPQLQAARCILAGTEAGLAMMGLEHESVDLAAGLAIALDASLENLHRSWRAGEPVFREAEDDEATKEAMSRWAELRPAPDRELSP